MVMTDLETFRTVLRGPDDGRPPAMDDIINAGQKLRRKRRRMTATVAAAALVVATGATVAVWPAPAQGPSPVQAAAWPSTPSRADGSWGQPVDTGIKHQGRRIVVTAFHNNNAAYPNIKFGVRACAATADDQLAPCTNTFDDVAPDNSPGFHSIELPTGTDGVDFPMYGYYVGPAATITVKSRGRVVTAKTALWSENPDVVLFWFPLDQVFLKPDKTSPLYKQGKVTPGELPDTSEWSAWDVSGVKLPLGKPFVIG
jgi:hypothetical protein